MAGHKTTVEPLYCGYHGTTAACLDYRSIRISEASGIFPVGVAIHTCAVEYNEGAFCRALPCCTLARNADQRLELYEPIPL